MSNILGPMQGDITSKPTSRHRVSLLPFFFFSFFEAPVIKVVTVFDSSKSSVFFGSITDVWVASPTVNTASRGAGVAAASPRTLLHNLTLLPRVDLVLKPHKHAIKVFIQTGPEYLMIAGESALRTPLGRCNHGLYFLNDSFDSGTIVCWG